MQFIPRLKHLRSMFIVALSTALMFLTVAALRPTHGSAQAPAYCYLSTPLELTPGGGAQATYFTRSGHVLGWASDADGQYRRFTYNDTGIHDLDAALGSGGQFTINESHKAMSEEGSVFGVGSDYATIGQYAVIFDGDGAHRITLGGSIAVAIDINDAGQAIGAASNEDETTFHAFRYDHGTLTDLGTLGGARSYPNAISENGKVAGSSTNAQEERHAFLYDETGMHDLGLLPGGTWSTALAVNDAGQVAGVAEVAGGQHAFLYDGTTMHDLGALPGGTSSAATHINASGQVVGWSDAPGNAQHIFLYDGTTMLDLTPNATRSEVLRFTDSGVVVGQAYAPDYVFVYDASGLHNISLGGLASNAQGSFGGFGVTNRSGLVAGSASMPGNTTLHAFLYDGSSGLQDLNAMLGDYGEALGINETGQVVGTSDWAAFLYEGGVMKNLNDFMCTPGVTLDAAYGVSDDGKILAANPYQGQLFLLTRRRVSAGFAQPYGGS